MDTAGALSTNTALMFGVTAIRNQLTETQSVAFQAALIWTPTQTEKRLAALLLWREVIRWLYVPVSASSNAAHASSTVSKVGHN